MEKPDAKTQTELSSRTAAVFSWLEFLGMLIYLVVSFSLGRNHWMLPVAVLMLAAGYFYKTYVAWKAGNKKAVRIRIVILFVALTLALIVGYIAGQKPYSLRFTHLIAEKFIYSPFALPAQSFPPN